MNHGERTPKETRTTHRAALCPQSAALTTGSPTTASAQKRRKIGLFGGAAETTTTSSPTPSGADSPSPPTDSSSITRGATPTPPRYLPPHLHDEVQVRSGGVSPIASLEQVSLDAEGGAGMSGEGEGKSVSAGHVRSASPAKRSRADMEGEEKVAGSSSGQEREGKMTDFDEAMAGMTPAQAGDVETQTTVDEGVQTSASESMATTSTSATSFQSGELSSESAQTTTEQKGPSIPSIDEQERIVRELHQKTLDEGQRGFAFSRQWLNRVLSRSSQGQHSSEFPKEAREGPIGPVDNSDLVPDGKFPKDPVKDASNNPYIPLKPGLALDEDYVLLPHEAYDLISGWYASKQGQQPIVRYAHNTAPPDAALPNMEYELHPPVFTIRKVPQPVQEERQPAPQTSYEALRKKREAQDRGAMSPEDAVRLVSSRSEKFQLFLRRAKEAADIPFSTKVKIWRTSKASNSVAKGNPTGVLSPPESRPASPSVDRSPSLVIDAASFNKMEECEPIDGKDETGNSNYNGSSTMDMYQLFEDSTLVLEEQIGGPAGGEYASDKKPKHTIKLGIPGRSIGSKAPSAAPSRGASPAPSGMMTRGRQRRDGRTRGTVGLSNLGNTCYMNSALQCIRSVEELAIYFLSDKYKKEINSNNPLGHGGVMAKQYGNLLNNIYGESAGGSFTPSAFKKTLGQLQPMFSGYGQQDSQEFLSFLVDAIHEDLNRIQKKPYNENPDSDDNTVRDPQAIIDLGETYRANHRARNESIAMDLFNGFYKNTMECPNCGKISITFDPFSLVTVQLPIESMFTHTYIFVPLDGKPVKHDIDFDKNGTTRALKEYVASKHPGVDVNRLWMAEVYSHKLYKVFDDGTTLAEAGISGGDHIFIFELPEEPSNAPAPSKAKKYTGYGYGYGYGSNKEEEAPEMDDPKADRFAVPVFSRQKHRFGSGWEWILHPTFIVLTREEAKDYDVVLKKTLVAISRLTTMPILTEPDNLKRFNDESEDEKTENGVESTEDKEVSDRSVSEDGYVEISKHADAEAPQTNGDAMDTNGVAEQGDRPVPKGFMDSNFILPPALRDQLFVMKYGKGKEGMHCTGLSSLEERGIVPMPDRVKLPTRRGSTDSSTSGDESTASTASGADANGEAEVQDSDAEFEDKPDILIGGQTEDNLGLSNPTGEDDESDGLPDNPLIGRKPGATRGQKQWRGKNKGRNRRQKTYGKKDRQKPNNQPNGNARSPFGGKSLPKHEDDEDNPYYIKLGEGIVLDWYPEALTQLFAGNTNDADDQRGSFTSTADGKGEKLPLFHDSVIEEKRAKRSARRKHGVSLEECFFETGKREVLSEDNAWYCNRCKELRRATKTLEIWTIPDILVVHLKRFGGNRSFRDKIDVLVDYPIEGLDMTERVGLKEDGKEYIYDLFAVDNHYGGLGGGHYTAYAKNFYDNEWYDYNGKCARCRSLERRPLTWCLSYRCLV